MEKSGGRDPVAEKAQEQAAHMADRIFAAAQSGAVFGAPVVSGAYTVITASAVGAGGGWGFGSGSTLAAGASAGGEEAQETGGGAGGGGGSMGRPIAAIVVGPDGVKVQPIVDATKIALAAITAWGTVALLAVRLARQKR